MKSLLTNRVNMQADLAVIMSLVSMKIFTNMTHNGIWNTIQNNAMLNLSWKFGESK